MSTPPSSAPASSQMVADIFRQAGGAFATLAELTAELNSGSPSASGEAAQGAGGKWSEEEVEMLHRAVATFAEDLTVVSARIKGRMVGQIKATLKKKALEEAGAAASSPSMASPPHQRSLLSPKSATASSEVTLNALNAADNEVDVEGLGGGHVQQ